MNKQSIQIIDDLDHESMIRCVQRHRLNGFQWVCAVKDMMTGRYRVEARRLI